MKFSKDLSNRPITYDLIQSFNLCVNILKAEINHAFEGLLVLDIEGKSSDIAGGLKYLEAAGVEADLITNSIEIDPDRCVSCGLCTGLCSVRALVLSKEERALDYQANRCVGCNQCVGVCPTGAIENAIW